MLNSPQVPNHQGCTKVDEGSITEYSPYNWYHRNPLRLDFTAPRCPAVDVSPALLMATRFLSLATNPSSQTYSSDQFGNLRNILDM